jgi:transposase
VAHSILVVAYHVLSRGQSYDDLRPDYFLRRDDSDAYRRRLIRQLERTGLSVTVAPAA